MKKFIAGVIIGALLTSTMAFSASYIANPPTFKVLVNGEEFVSDPPTLVVEGSTYLPLRAMGDALGVPVKWNEKLRQVEVGKAHQEITTNIVQSNDKWKITYLGYKECTQISQFTKASEGKHFVIVTFDVENISNETQTFSMFWLNSYFDDYKTPLKIIGEQIDGATLLGSNTIESGKKIKGYLAYEIENDWNNLDIVYNEAIDVQDTINKIEFNIDK